MTSGGCTTSTGLGIGVSRLFLVFGAGCGGTGMRFFTSPLTGSFPHIPTYRHFTHIPSDCEVIRIPTYRRFIHIPTDWGGLLLAFPISGTLFTFSLTGDLFTFSTGPLDGAGPLDSGGPLGGSGQLDCAGPLDGADKSFSRAANFLYLGTGGGSA